MGRMLILGIELTWFDLLYLRDHDPTFDRVLTSWLTRTRRKEAQKLPLTIEKTRENLLQDTVILCRLPKHTARLCLCQNTPHC
jgi:hypothetical protein